MSQRTTRPRDKDGSLFHLEHSNVGYGGGRQPPPMDLLLVLHDNVHRHQNIESVVYASPDILLVVSLREKEGHSFMTEEQGKSLERVFFKSVAGGRCPNEFEYKAENHLTRMDVRAVCLSWTIQKCKPSA